MTIFSKTALIRLYDQRENTLHGSVARQNNDQAGDASEGSHVSAITGLLGEDLILGLFKHYWEAQSKEATCVISSYQCYVEERKKLDALLVCTSATGHQTLYQTEIKNWSHHSIGPNYNLVPETGIDMLNETSITNLSSITGKSNKKRLRKVTGNIRADKMPDNLANFEATPLLCMWMPLQTETADGAPFFQISEDHQYLPNVWVFSASIYLRGLNCDQVDIHTPRLAHRMEMLKQLILCQ